MANRVVSYIFRGDFRNLTAGLTAASRSVADLGDRLTAADQQGRQFRQGLTTVADTAGKIGLAAATGVGAMVLATANFDKQMSMVAATGKEAKGSLDQLREAAIQAGADTAFSASEAANGIENLLKAGVSARDVLGGGLTGALDLAAAGTLDVADAAEIAATTMTQFGLAGTDVPHIADLLAAAAGKAQGEVTDMAASLKYVGPVASQMGISLEETTGAIAELASQGVLGSEAGTSLRGMLTSLTSPSKAAKDQMDALGISLYDAQGAFVGFDGLAGQLQSTMSGLTNAERDQALGRIFGNEQITAARILYAGGAEDVQKWTTAVNDSGYAAATASTKLDNLAGDWEALKGSIETALIGTGEGSTGFFREMVQGATAATNAYNDLPGPVKNASGALLGLTAAVGGGLFLTVQMVNGISAARLAMTQLGVSTATTSKLLTVAGRSAGVAAGAFAGLAVIDALQGSTAKALPGVQELTGRLIELSQVGSDASLPKGFDDIGDAIDRLANPNRAQALQDGIAGVIGFGGGSELADSKAQIESLDAAFSSLVSSAGPDAAARAFDQLTESSGLSAAEIKDLTSLLPQYKDSLAGAANTATLTSAATQGLTASTSAAVTAMQNERKALNESVTAMHAKRDATLGAFDAETQYRQALKEATAQGKKTNSGIRGNSEAALENRAKISALAAAWNNQSAAVQNNRAKFKEARAAFIDSAIAMGVPKKAAEDLAKKLLDIPKSRVVKLSADTTSAMTNVQVLENRLANLHDKTIRVTVNQSTNATVAEHHSANGSTVPKGGPYADKYPYLLAPGEEVISNRHGQADRHRPLLKAINAGRAADGTTVGAGPYRYTYGGAAGASLDKLGKAADDSKKAISDEAKARRDAVKERRQATSSAVSESLTTDIFNVDSSNPWATSGADPLAALRGQIRDAAQFRKARRELTAKGVHGQALASILNEGLGVASEMSDRSRSYLRNYQHLYTRADRAVDREGRASGAAVVDQVRALHKEVTALRGDVRQGAKDSGREFGRELNNASNRGTRGQHRGQPDLSVVPGRV